MADDTIFLKNGFGVRLALRVTFTLKGRSQVIALIATARV